MIVYTTLTIPAVMLLEAFLSFLGLGVQPPMSSWGVLIKDGAEKMEEFWWLLVFPGRALLPHAFLAQFPRRRPARRPGRARVEGLTRGAPCSAASCPTSSYLRLVRGTLVGGVLCGLVYGAAAGLACRS